MVIVLAQNLLTNFQIETGAARRPGSRKRTVRHLLQTVQTLRCVLFHRAARVTGAGGMHAYSPFDRLSRITLWRNIWREREATPSETRQSG